MIDRIHIEELADAFVICRGLGHSWDDNPGAEIDSDLWRISTGALALRCTRCGAERFDYINSEMSVFQRYYRYPPRYTTVVGEGKRPNLRGEMLRRSLLIRTFDANGKARGRRR
jgi:hypothetical protein